ncbi:hypothetical protein CMV_005522 [Castanea mollissima]|uniref:Uncharacterized protein n=1 Tax=Castanea mollissima TaxID=60419 RepID=A0A8J4RQG9_9ROSI|nr:hypothetical protein CMV_005522 [Castanea mollissima]
MKKEKVSERNGDGFGRSWRSSRDVEDRFDYGRDRCDRSGSQESVSSDVLDLLPSDPFGMDISTTFTAITGWLEDFQADYGGNEVGISDGSYQLFAGLNFIWNNALKYQSFSGNMGVDYKFDVAGGIGGRSGKMEVGDTSCRGSFGSNCNMDGILGLGNETPGVSGQQSEACPKGNGIYSVGDSRAPHGALNFQI